MRLFRNSLVCAVVLLIVGGAYAAYIVNQRAVKKLDLLASQQLELPTSQQQQIKGDAKNGEYVAIMSGCIACHTHYAEGGAPMAGGVPIETPFGTFYSPNITSDKDAGIGQWTTTEFVTAMSVGKSPEDEHYYPAFPYAAYSVMSLQELIDLKAWLDTVEPVPEKAPSHAVAWPVTIRSAVFIWKALYFDPLRSIDNTDRGSYLVNGPGHCAECHASRNLLGGVTDRSLSGNSRGPDGESVPGITSTDLAEWSVEDLELFLEVGITVSGDFTGGHMSDVIEFGTAQLTPEDRISIALYLLSDANKP